MELNVADITIAINNTSTREPKSISSKRYKIEIKTFYLGTCVQDYRK